MKKINLILLAILITAVSFSLIEKGNLKGIVKDAKTNAPSAYTNLQLIKGASIAKAVQTDLDGKYSFNYIEPGYYTLLCFNSAGYDTLKIDSLKIKSGMNEDLDIKLSNKPKGELKTVKITTAKSKPMYAKDSRKTTRTLESVSFRGSRADGTSYYVDSEIAIGEHSSKKMSTKGRSLDYSSYDVTEDLAISKPDKKPTFESKVRHSVLTAGEVRDFNKWNLWEDLTSGSMKEYTKIWGLIPSKRYTVQLLNKINLPLVNRKVTLINKDGKVVFETRTDNTGKAELWSNVQINMKTTPLSNPTIKIQSNGKNYSIKRAKEFSKGINTLKIKESCNQSNEVDILFAVDATGSMGDEINYLKSDLKNLIKKVKTNNKDLQFNFGGIYYRDKTDKFLTNNSEFSSNENELINFIRSGSANGGGDFPEAVDAAMDVALNQMKWRENARTKIMFLLLDAPPHRDSLTALKIQRLTLEAAKRNIRIVPVGCSGIDKSTEYLMRTMALMTNGNYIFLTDHSGVGNPHIKPSTDEYKVETLNDVMARTIQEFIFVPSCDNKTKKEVLQDTLVVSSSQIIDRVIIDSNLSIKWPNGKDSLPILIDTVQVNQDTTDMKDTLQQVMFKAYPNPTNGPLTIEVSPDIKVIYLSDFTGKILEKYTFNMGETKTSMQLKQYPAGTYIIRAWQNGKWVIGKIILTNRKRYD